MPFPEFFVSLMQSRKFWRDFFWLSDGATRSSSQDPSYPQLANFKLEMPVGDGFGLSLSFDADLITTLLDFLAPGAQPVRIAWDDQAHWHPHVMRWRELEMICRAMAVKDAELNHPGWVVLLLQRFAPICVGDDVETIAATLEAAWRRVGVFSDNEITAAIERIDARDANFRWRKDESLGWVIEQDDDSRNWKGLYTLRNVENDTFPFDAWRRMIDAAHYQQLQLTNVDRCAAERFAATGSSEEIPGIATALRAAGHEAPAHSLEANASPAEACWICEAILDQPAGAIVRRHMSHECLPRKQHHLKLSLPYDDERRPVPPQYGRFLSDTLNCVLNDLCSGTVSCTGGSSKKDEHGNFVEVNSNYSVHLTGSLGQSMGVIRDLLWWGKAPASVRISNSTNEDIQLQLESGETKSDRLVLELAKPTVFRWKSGYRIDRAALSPSCQAAVRETLDRQNVEGPSSDGWFTVRTADHGLFDLCAEQLGVSESLAGITLVIDVVTPSTSALVYELMQLCELILLPLRVAASKAATALLSADWPTVKIVASASELHEILAAGAFHWWSQP